MGKLSALATETTYALTDFIVKIKSAGAGDVKVALSDFLNVVFNQVNIPTGGGSPVTMRAEMFFDFVKPGTGVWSADAAGSTRNGSMTALTTYVNGRRIIINSVSARVFTASKDTYVDVLDNADGTGTLVYTEVTNGAASPTLAANSIRIAIVITSAGSIPSSTSVNQGQEGLAPYEVTDSLGNLICPRDPSRKILGYRIAPNASNFTTSTTPVATTLSCPVIIPANRKIKVTASAPQVLNSSGTAGTVVSIWDGTVGSGTQITTSSVNNSVANGSLFVAPEVIVTPSSTSKTYNVGLHVSSGTGTMSGAANQPNFIKVELM